MTNFSLFLLFPILRTDLLILWTKIIRFLTYIMAKRTKNLLPQIISFLQNGFIWQRQKQDNVLMQSMMDNKLQAVRDRAFKWTGNFYRKQYKNTFIKKYPSLLSNPKAKLIINGDMTKVFSFQFSACRGTRQSCAIGPLQSVCWFWNHLERFQETTLGSFTSL